MLSPFGLRIRNNDSDQEARALGPSARGLLVLTLFAGLSLGCKDKEPPPAPDPLDDPWLDALDEDEDGDEGAALTADPAAAPSADPSRAPELAQATLEAAGALAAAPGEALPPDTDAAGEPDADADPSAPKAAPKAGGSPGSGAGTPPQAAEATDPDANPDPDPDTDTDTPQGSDAPAPEAAPQPAPEAAPVEPTPPEPAGPPPLTLADFGGTYGFVGGSSQREDLTQAIEKAVASLNIAIRGIGRKRLTKTNPIDSWVELTVIGDKVRTRFTSGFDVTCTVDGASCTWTNKKGVKHNVRLRRKGHKLIQTIVGADGTKTSVFVLSADRTRLTVHHKITAERLPDPMTYRFSYKRK